MSLLNYKCASNTIKYQAYSIFSLYSVLCRLLLLLSRDAMINGVHPVLQKLYVDIFVNMRNS